MVAEEYGAELLILGGPELGEPIARYGPCHEHATEIYQAIEDYNNERWHERLIGGSG